MKKLIVLSIVTLVSLAAFGQTNIIVKVTVEELGGTTNSTTLKLDGAGTKRDQMLVAGQVAKFQAQAGTTNSVAMDVMIRQQIKGMLEYDGLAHNAMMQAALLIKLGLILTEQPELLTNADKSQLAAIAAKLP